VDSVILHHRYAGKSLVDIIRLAENRDGVYQRFVFEAATPDLRVW